MLEGQPDRGAPYQAEDMTWDSNDTLKRGQSGEQANGHIETHRPRLFAEMITVHVIGLGIRRNFRCSSVFGHSLIVARRTAWSAWSSP